MKLRALPDELNGEILVSPERHGYEAHILFHTLETIQAYAAFNNIGQSSEILTAMVSSCVTSKVVAILAMFGKGNISSLDLTEIHVSLVNSLMNLLLPGCSFNIDECCIMHFKRFYDGSFPRKGSDSYKARK